MCGIALIVAGVRIDLSALHPTFVTSDPLVEQPLFSTDDVKAALSRRGPDSIGSKKILFKSKISSSFELQDILSPEVGAEAVKSDLQYYTDSSSCISSANEKPPMIYGGFKIPKSVAELYFLGATLQLRGRNPIIQPLVDASGNILVYNGLGEEGQMNGMSFWEELPCGVYSIQMGISKEYANVVGEVKRHEWSDPMLNELIKWERASVQPKAEDLTVSQMNIHSCQHDTNSVHPTEVAHDSGLLHAAIVVPAEAVLIALREAVARRAATNTMFKVAKCHNIQEGQAPVAVLFSGGLDSMILAALLDKCLDLNYEIDLLNVSFDKETAPDRISARAGVKELKRISPLRRWKLVEIDAELSNLTLETKHVKSLINPAKTYMDLNIGLALWLAAGGDGWVSEERISHSDNDEEDYQRIKYKSEARILLVGSGADEQCAGYGRHRTKYRIQSWLGLHEEMKLDMQRIWKRNLGRDDRCIADNGKEARFPFLDEDVIRTLLSIPLWKIADLDQPSGKGDKKILREVAWLLNLHEAAVLPKRAIQFGSRIARESNRKNFGSNRAANQAAAGSVEI